MPKALFAAPGVAWRFATMRLTCSRFICATARWPMPSSRISFSAVSWYACFVPGESRA
jgi:hypothetical protein